MLCRRLRNPSLFGCFQRVWLHSLEAEVRWAMGADKKDDAGLFGWKNWKIPDDWTVVEHDRTPRSVSLLLIIVSLKTMSCCSQPLENGTLRMTWWSPMTPPEGPSLRLTSTTPCVTPRGPSPMTSWRSGSPSTRTSSLTWGPMSPLPRSVNLTISWASKWLILVIREECVLTLRSEPLNVSSTTGPSRVSPPARTGMMTTWSASQVRGETREWQVVWR